MTAFNRTAQVHHSECGRCMLRMKRGAAAASGMRFQPRRYCMCKRFCRLWSDNASCWCLQLCSQTCPDPLFLLNFQYKPCTSSMTNNGLRGLEVNEHEKHHMFWTSAWPRCMCMRRRDKATCARMLPVVMMGQTKRRWHWLPCLWLAVLRREARIHLRKIIVHLRRGWKRQWKAIKEWVDITMHKWGG